MRWSRHIQPGWTDIGPLRTFSATQQREWALGTASLTPSRPPVLPVVFQEQLQGLNEPFAPPPSRAGTFKSSYMRESTLS